MNDACGWEVIDLESVGSTNDYLKERLQGLHDRTVVTARRQTAGRGRLGRTWASPPGGLYASLLLKPPPVPELAQRVSLLAAEILCGIMGEAGMDACIKWPNDVLVDDRKIAGILPEFGTKPEPWFILGAGVNLVSAPPVPDGRGLPSTAWSEYARPPAPGELLASFLSCLDAAWPDRSVDPLAGGTESISRRLWRFGRTVHISRGSDAVTGVVTGIDAKGRLVLRSDSGTTVLDSGEIGMI